jgi:thiamine monophosphate kinase
MDEKGPISRRVFWEGLLHDAVNLIAEVKKNLNEGQRIGEVLSSFEDYPIVGTYPAELFESEAERLGIDIKKMGEKEAIRQIVADSLSRKSK